MSAAVGSKRFLPTIAAMLVAFDLALLGLTGYFLKASHDNVYDRARSATSSIAEAVSLTISSNIEKAYIGILSIAKEAERGSVAGGNDLPRMNASIKSLLAELPFLLAIRVTDEKGDLIYGIEPGTKANAADRDYFIRLRDDPRLKFVISKPVVGRINNRWSCFIACRWNKPDGRFAGVVLGVIPLENFSRLFSTLNLAKKDMVSLRDAEMGLMVRYPEPKGPGVAVGQTGVSPQFQKLLDLGKTEATYVAKTGSDGIERVLSYRRIAAYPLHMVVGVATENLLGPWLLQAFWALLLVPGVLLLSGAAMWLILRYAREKTAHEGELRKSEERFRTIFDKVGDGIIVADATTREFITANAAASQLLGYTKAELERMSVQQIHPEHAWADVSEVFARQARGELAVAPALPLLRKDGVELLADISAAPLEISGRQCVVGLFRDITQQKLAEEALRKKGEELGRSEALLKESQRVARIGHYLLDIGNNCWTSSEALDEIFGISADFSRTAEGWLHIVHPEDRETMRRYFTDDVMGAGRPFDREYRIQRFSDGREAWVHGVGHLEFGPNGRPTVLFGTIQDVTERKHAETERIEMERRLLHVQKLESLGVLAGGIAHDFNNLLMAILGNLELALHEMSPLSGSRDLIEQAISASQRAADLTRQMLAYSGKGRFVVSRFDLGELVRENVHLFRASIAKNISFDVRGPERLPEIEADPGQIQQVVMNLITNASEALGAEPGTIVVETGVREYSETDLLESRAEVRPDSGVFVFLDVIDTGVGMDEDTRRKVFDPFFSTKSFGRGLGMSAILGIVGSQKGAIFVDSAPGRGTRIRVAFPVASAQQADAPVAPETGSSDKESKAAAERRGAPEGRGRKVLVVDDEEEVRSVCARILEYLGYETLLARDGAEAVDVYRRRCSEIDFVVMDLSMPQMDGLTAARLILSEQPQAKILLSSGYDEGDSLRQFEGIGLKGFIQKPYTPSALRDLLRETLGVETTG